jgi:allophanate hydrolase
MGYDGSLSIDALRAAYADGLGVSAVIASVYERIERERANPIWISLVSQEVALARARELERDTTGRAGMPLFGIPFAVKDNIDVAGMPTTAACPDFAYVPTADAFVVHRLIEAGAILIGKTNLDQFATGLVGTRSPYGVCRNAFDPEYISGGSSAGSALAVALDLVSFALGTDTAGSGRVPAAFNNIVGLKPTPGAISTAGVVPACRSLDCVSILASDCADAADVLDVAAGFDPHDPYAREAVTGATKSWCDLRVGVPRKAQREFHGDAGYAALFDVAIERTRRLGARIREIDFTPFLEVQRLLYEGPWLAERIAGIGDFPQTRPDSLHPVTRTLFESANAVTGVDVFRGMYRLAQLRREVCALFADMDLLFVPGAPTIYRIEDVARSPLELNARLGRYTNFVNLLSLAAITVPAGFRADGLPFGVTLIGESWSDHVLAELGGKLHAASNIAVGAARRRLPRAVRRNAQSAPPSVHIAVVGAHLSGLPLNAQLTDRGARWVRTTKTRDCYRLYALPGGSVPRPGLVRTRPDDRGGAIEAEVWAMPLTSFGSFVQEIPAPLAIGTVLLDDGSEVKGFLCEAAAVDDSTEITQFGGWRAYLAQRDAGTST